MRRQGWVAALVFVSLFSVLLMSGPSAAADKLISKLTIAEESGVARMNEPVTWGVPLPEGLVTDTGKLALVNSAGKPIACQFTEVVKWPERKSIKWVHMDFQLSIGAGEKKVVSLILRDSVPKVESNLKAVMDGDDVVVTTGPLKFRIHGKHFNGFAQVWHKKGGGEFTARDLVIDTSDGGGGFGIEGAPFLTRNDADAKASIELAGPMKVVAKVAGSHKNAAGERKIDYICRFHAYNNSPIVRVSYTFVNRQGQSPADNFGMTAHYFDVPTLLKGGKFLIGSEKRIAQGELAGNMAWIFQDTSDHYSVKLGAKELSTGKGKSTKPLTTGWAAIEKGGRGVAVGVRWFWQMFPKTLKVEPDGNLHLGLYPKEFRDEVNFTYPRPIYMGVARTHYLTFLFYDEKKPEELGDFFAGSQNLLMAWAPGKYYLRDTHCFGYAAESDPKLYDAEAWKVCQQFDKTLAESIDLITRKLDGHTYTVTRDSYGFFAWGDQFHWAWNTNTPHDKNISWAGNYYDFPNACLMQYLRTGNKKFLARFLPNAIHVGDVFTCHYHPKKELWGACRYCPARNHMALDNGRPYVSVEYNHNKSQCVFAHYYLTGDLRTLDNIKLMMNNGYENHAADSGWAWRGIGAQLALLWQSYELTLDEKYKQRAADMAERCMTKSGKGGFYGVALEGAVYYHWMTGDAAVKGGLERMTRRQLEGKGGPLESLGTAYMYYLTGNEEYRRRALEFLSGVKVQNRPKNFGMQFRNAAFAWYYLSNIPRKLPRGKWALDPGGLY